MMSRFVFLLLTVSTLFVSTSQAQNRCINLIQRIEQKSIFLFNTTEIKPQTLLETAFESFSEKTQIDQVAHVFNKIDKKGSNSIGKNDIKALKTARKQFSILRSALQISTINHSAPKYFDNFVKDFGHLNDYIANKNYKSADKLLPKLKVSMSNINIIQLKTDSNLTTPESVKKYYTDLKIKAYNMMNSKTISLDAYHDIRKVIREFLSLADLADQISPSSQNKTNYNFLVRLNIKLGKTNDVFTKKIISGKYDKHHTQIEFPKELRKEVEYFIRELYID